MENIFPTPIAKQNSTLLASLSVVFFTANGIKSSPEMIEAFADATMDAIEKWYRTNKGREFDPMTELVEEDAVKYAFKHMQKIVTLVQMAKAMGITPAELGIS